MFFLPMQERQPRLQWGRRVNATESGKLIADQIRAEGASMGPPRERDGESQTS